MPKCTEQFSKCPRCGCVKTKKVKRQVRGGVKCVERQAREVCHIARSWPSTMRGTGTAKRRSFIYFTDGAS